MELRDPEWFYIKDRGHVCSFDLPEPVRAGDLRAMKGKTITVDGIEMQVRGVETFAVGDERPLRNVAFLVDDESAGKAGRTTPSSELLRAAFSDSATSEIIERAVAELSDTPTPPPR